VEASISRKSYPANIERETLIAKLKNRRLERNRIAQFTADYAAGRAFGRIVPPPGLK
jgi:hypothetical protein